MKFLFLSALLVLSSCAPDSGSSSSAGACSGSIVKGTWRNSFIDDTIVFNADCTFSNTSCSSTGTYPNVTAQTGLVAVNITSTSGVSGCLPIGQTTCSYSIANNVMTYGCGGGSSNYIKQ